MPLTPEQHIEAFIHIIKQQPSVFSDENRIDLEQKIDKCPEEDVLSLFNAISAWCRKSPDIRKAWSETRKSLFGSTPGKGKAQHESIPKPKPEDYKKLLKNQMRESFRETTKEQKPQDTSK